MSKSTWIRAGKVSAAVAAIALVLGAIFQAQAQQRADMADVRTEMRAGFAEITAQMDRRFAQVDNRFAQVDNRFAQMDRRLDGISRDLASLRERVGRIEGRLALPAEASPQATGGAKAGKGGRAPEATAQ